MIEGLDPVTAKKEERRRARERARAEAWKVYLKSAQDAKAEYDSMATEAMRYTRPRHSHQQAELTKSFMDLSNEVFLTSPKAAQIRSILGPHLYQRDPARLVVSKSNDGVMSSLAAVLQAYLDYTPREVKLGKHIRKAINDALVRGRGFLRTGYHAGYDLITSWFVSSRDVLVDADADCIEDAKWIAIRRREPVWEAKRRLRRISGRRSSWRFSGLKAALASEGGSRAYRAGKAFPDDRYDGPGTNDLVEVWDIYSKMGGGLHRGVEAPEDQEDSEDYVKIEVSMDHEFPLYVGDWDPPLYFDEEWPIVYLDLVDGLDQLWPDSLFGLVVAHQKAINTFTTLEALAAKNHTSERIVYDKRVGKLAADTFAHGPPFVMVPIDVAAGTRISEAFYRLDPGSAPNELAAARAYHENEMATTTGAHPLLFGGQYGAADRSAAASQIKREGVGVRLDDLRSRVERFLEDAARNEGLSIRLPGAMDWEDVSRVVRDIDLGYLVSIIHGGEIPVRDRADTKELADLARAQLGEQGTDEELAELARAEELAPLSLESFAPEIATYFPTPEEAVTALTQAVVRLQGEAQAGTIKPRYMEVLASIIQVGPDGAIQLAPNIRPRPVTVEDVWRDTSGIDPVDLAREVTFEVKSGSTIRWTPDVKREFARDLILNALPAALSAQQLGIVNAIWDRWQESWGVPDSERMPSWTAPEPSPAAPAGGGVQ